MVARCVAEKRAGRRADRRRGLPGGPRGRRPGGAPRVRSRSAAGSSPSSASTSSRPSTPASASPRSCARRRCRSWPSAPKKLPRETDALELAATAVRDGARGVVFGRNLIQADEPGALPRGAPGGRQARRRPGRGRREARPRLSAAVGPTGDASCSASTSGPRRSRPACSTTRAACSRAPGESTGSTIRPPTGPSSTRRRTGRRRSARSGPPWARPAPIRPRVAAIARLQPGRDRRRGRRPRPAPRAGPRLARQPRRGRGARARPSSFDDRPVYDRTGVPSINPTWTAAKLLWWRRHEPGLFGAATAVPPRRGLRAPPADRPLRDRRRRPLHLAPVRHPEPRLVGRDARRRSGSTPSACPRSSPRATVVGRSRAAAAEALGLLARRVVVVAGGMDQGAGAVGVGNLGPGVISESTGGALTVQASVAHHGGDPTGQTPVYVHSAPGPLPLLPGLPDRRHGPDLVPRPRSATRRSRGRRRGAAAPTTCSPSSRRTSRPGADGLTMLPHLAGAFSPEYVPEARGVFYGFTLHHGKAALRAGRPRGGGVHAAAQPRAARGRRRDRRPRSGRTAAAPAARSGTRIKADVCGLPVVTLEGDDAAVRGDAMLAGVATGVFARPRRRPARRWSGRATASSPIRHDPGRLRRRRTAATRAVRRAPAALRGGRASCVHRSTNHPAATTD